MSMLIGDIMKDSLEQIQVNDFVIVSGKNDLLLKKVTKVTNTQIHIGDTKYRKDGSEINSDKWHSTRIYAPNQKRYVHSSSTALEEYKTQKDELQKEKAELISEIKAFDLEKLPISKLRLLVSHLNH